MATLTASEKHSMEVIRSLFGRSSRDVGELLESIGVYACLCCSKGEKIVLPYIGELDVEYAGENVTARGKSARLKTEFTPSPFLSRCVGQLHDGVDTDAEAILMNRFRAVFKERAGE